MLPVTVQLHYFVVVVLTAPTHPWRDLAEF